MVGMIQIRMMGMLVAIGITMLIFSIVGGSSATGDDIEVKITNIWGSNYPIVLFSQSATLGQVVSADLDSSPISEPVPTLTSRPRNEDKSVVSRFKISDTKVRILAYIAGGKPFWPGSEGYIKITNPEWKITEILKKSDNSGIGASYYGTGTNIDTNNGIITWSFRGGCSDCGYNEGEFILEFIVENVAPPKSSLSITKSASPYSLRQFQESTIKVLIENSGTSEVKAIEIMDSIHPSFDLTGGDFPNPKKFASIRAGESRELQYTIKSKDSGAFTLDSATVTYADSEGNIQEVESEPVSIKVVSSSEGGSSGANTGQNSKSASVSLHGEKTDVVMGEDILLRLSAVNLITKPKMHVQVIIIPPSGMSVTSSEFSKSAAGQFTANYQLEPGDGKDIEVRIRSNQVGDFNVNGRIIYYFGDDKEKAEDQTLNLPIKVRKEIASITDSIQKPSEKSPGFEIILAGVGMILALSFRRR